VDALKVRKRMELGNEENRKRETRQYVKKNTDWWDRDIYSTRSKRREDVRKEIAGPTTHVSSTASETEAINLDTLTPVEMKEMLKKKYGVTTRVRKQEKLLELLKTKVNEAGNM
jgi:hypothetical protein